MAGSGQESGKMGIGCSGWSCQGEVVEVWSPHRTQLNHLFPLFQTVCVTACGNYAVAGSSTGQIRCWNLQSGHERKVFNLAGVTQPTQKSRNLARSKAVRVGKSITGLATDALNSVLVAATLDGTLNVSSVDSLKLWRLAYFSRDRLVL
jgi:WD40 repeat protein